MARLNQNASVFGKVCPIGEIVRHLPLMAASETVATARIAPKIYQGQPQHLVDTVPDFIQIGLL